MVSYGHVLDSMVPRPNVLVVPFGYLFDKVIIRFKNAISGFLPGYLNCHFGTPTSRG